jgi:hypothetical protein
MFGGKRTLAELEIGNLEILQHKFTGGDSNRFSKYLRGIWNLNNLTWRLLKLEGFFFGLAVVLKPPLGCAR